MKILGLVAWVVLFLAVLFVAARQARDAGLLDEYPRTEFQALERDREVLVGRMLDLEAENARLLQEIIGLNVILTEDLP